MVQDILWCMTVTKTGEGASYCVDERVCNEFSAIL